MFFLPYDNFEVFKIITDSMRIEKETAALKENLERMFSERWLQHCCNIRFD
jgi:hypothetical protein